MINDRLFEILVYSSDQARLNKKIRAYVEKGFPQGKTPVSANEAEIDRQLREEAYQVYGKSVRFNELVGCVEVYVVHTQLRADLWFTEKSRIYVGAKTRGVIRRRGKLLEKHYRFSRRSSAEIFHDFRNSLLERLARRARLRGRYVDLVAFDRLGPYIDWREILGLSALAPGRDEQTSTQRS